MLSNRIIPVLVLSGEGIIKTKNFKYYKYLGDPINIVKLFNEKKVDELIIFDINANKTEINYKLLEKISRQCRMPLCYGGGVRSVSEAKKILSLGIEKISFSALFYSDKAELKKIIKQIGNQSVVITLDFKPTLLGGYNFFTLNGTNKVKIDLDTITEQIRDLNPGELVLNSINRDCTGKGYDIKILEHFSSQLNIPITIAGGAKDIYSFHDAIKINTNVGCAGGKMFSLKGNLDAVLIQYLSEIERETILKFREYVT